MLKLVGGQLVTPEGTKHASSITLSNGQIHSIGNEAIPSDTHVIQLPEEWIVAPGFVDLHIHGAHGADVMDGTPEALRKMQQCLPEEGTTSFLATTMTQSEQAIHQALTAVAAVQTHPGQGAELLGVHLEGPYISPDKAGAQPSAYIRAVNNLEFASFQQAAGGAIRVVTYAPELEGAEEFFRLLSESNVRSSFGHSAATYLQVQPFMQTNEIVHGTHLFNQMSPLHHRDVGLPGAFLLHDTHLVEIIADGIHVSDEMVRLVYKLKGASGIALITDSIRAKGLPDGPSELGGQEVFIQSGEARLADGTLAGSTLKMNEAFRRMREVTGCSLEEAVAMTATNAAKSLKLEDRIGAILPGMDADLVVMDAQYEVQLTICKGVIVYDNR